LSPVRASIHRRIAGPQQQLIALLAPQLVPLLERHLDADIVELQAHRHWNAVKRAGEIRFEVEDDGWLSHGGQFTLRPGTKQRNPCPTTQSQRIGVERTFTARTRAARPIYADSLTTRHGLQNAAAKIAYEPRGISVNSRH